ncbi:MAG TPA: NAD(+) synthase [Planctomycetota bacterium]|nr:NAD(+) synthase [Planctomycetota bacterium]
MKLIKVGAAVLNQTPLDWAGNKQRILAAIELAREQNVKLLCLPEMCICGYGCEDAFHSPGVHATSWQILKEILPSTHGMVVSLGLPLMHRNGIFNCAALVADTEIIGFVAKRYLAGDGIHYEPRWFKPWPNSVCAEIDIEGKTYPIGDIHFNVGGVRIGFEICEDAWVAKRPGGNLSLEGIDVILNPSASHFAFGKIETRKRFVLEGSRAFGVTYVYANLLGNESGRAIYDGGALIASSGRLLAMGSRLSFKAFDVTTAVVDVDATRMSQARTASFMPVLNPQEKNMAEADFSWPEIRPEPLNTELEAWERSPNIKEEEFFRAETLALFDYMRKSRSNGFIVSLSGGADSAACASLVAMTFERALKELGPQEFAARLGYIRGVSAKSLVKDGAEALTKSLLTCVYQSTQNSSQTTRNAAKAVADAIGAEFVEFDVDGLVKDYVSMVSRGAGRKLDWDRDDVALQNIQARVRAPGVWMLANIKGALLLTTSNRSEAAVGYATMDGDTAGGLAPIAGIDKHYLRKWLRWLEKGGPLGLHPIPALSAINVQAPTAELRPQDRKQTDEDDLMPYDLLDAVERAVIRDKRTPLEALDLVRLQFPQYPDKQLALWIERFFKLWCRNQWKRERYAPSFHLDDENLDPKTWCRFPILSGGFERELEQMKKSVK